jgi:hypothetical protein
MVSFSLISCKKLGTCVLLLYLGSKLMGNLRLRVRLELNTCLAAEPADEVQGETGNDGTCQVTEDEINRAALTIAHAMLNPRKLMICWVK